MKYKMMGIQWWNRPQISMHCPQKIPEFKKIATRWDENPGTQSILIPADGIDHEWITSLDEARIWSLISVGNAIAPVACNRTIFVIPFRIGLYWFLNNSALEPRLVGLLTPNK